MYDFLQQNISAQDSLKAKFNLRLENKTFKKSPAPYLLINLPCQQEELTINGKKMVIVEHHFSIPQKPDKLTNSVYHYTLVLLDLKTDKEYKTHLYFDRLDRVTLEPKLLSEDGEFLQINEASMKNIRVYAMQFTAVVIFIRKMQQEAISVIRGQIESTENELMNLSRNLEENKQHYVEMVCEQIQKLESLEAIGCALFIDEKRFYGRLLQRLNTTSTVIAKRSEEILPEPSIASEKSILSDNMPKPQSSVKAKKTKRKSKGKTREKSNIEFYNQLTQACNSAIEEFDNSNNITPKIIKNIINKVNDCRSTTLFLDDSCCASIVELKIKLMQRICSFFQNADLVKWHNLYLLAVKANIVPLRELFLADIVKNDNAEILNKVLSLNLIADSAGFKFDDSNNNFTLAEWCVFFNASNCFTELVNNGFSIEYVSENNSPFFMLIDDSLKAQRFAVAMASGFDALSVLCRRLCAIMEKRLMLSSHEEIALIKIKIEMLKITEKIYTLFSTDRKYKLLNISSYNSDLSLLNPEIINQLQLHIGYQQNALQIIERTLEVYIQTPIRELLRTLPKSNENSKGEVQATLITLNSLPVEVAVERIIAMQQVTLKMFNCFSILSSNTVSHERGYERKNRKSHTQPSPEADFIQELLDEPQSGFLKAFENLALENNNLEGEKDKDKADMRSKKVRY